MFLYIRRAYRPNGSISPNPSDHPTSFTIWLNSTADIDPSLEFMSLAEATDDQQLMIKVPAESANILCYQGSLV